MHMIILSASKTASFLSFQSILFISFSCLLIELASTTSTVLNRKGESRHASLHPDFFFLFDDIYSLYQAIQ